MQIDRPIVVALAALTGSLVGACSSVAATFIGQRLQARWSRLAAELDEHEELYGKFVDEAAPSIYRRSFNNQQWTRGKIMRLYSKVARIRLTSSEQVLHAAEEVASDCLRHMNSRRLIPLKVLERLRQEERAF